MEDGSVMINILYEDNHLLVVEKKVGVLSQSDGSNTPDMLTILKRYLKEKYHKPGNVYLGLVHRLDKNVGGVMVFAKTSKAARRLSEQIRNRKFKKTYLAICKGIIKSDGEWFEVERIAENEIELPQNQEQVRVKDGIKITHLVAATGAASGYSVVTATDYTLKIFSSLSTAYEQTIDELMLSQGAETVNIFMKLGWLPRFPIVYAQKYYQNIRNPYNGPLTDIKSDLKKKI